MSESMRHPSHRRAAPETPCEGCDPNQIEDCADNTKTCKAWKVYVRSMVGVKEWTPEMREVFK